MSKYAELTRECYDRYADQPVIPIDPTRPLTGWTERQQKIAARATSTANFAVQRLPAWERHAAWDAIYSEAARIAAENLR